jgi:hypothetical protein
LFAVLPLRDSLGRRGLLVCVREFEHESVRLDSGARFGGRLLLAAVLPSDPKEDDSAYHGDAIVVTLPGTSFQVTYKRHNGSLVATDFSGSDVQRKITMPVFLSQAWHAANEKAKELRWIA